MLVCVCVCSQSTVQSQPAINLANIQLSLWARPHSPRPAIDPCGRVVERVEVFRGRVALPDCASQVSFVGLRIMGMNRKKFQPDFTANLYDFC